MNISLAAGRELVAIPGPTVMPDRVLSAMHRPMPDIYSGELVEVTDEIFDALPPLAGTTSRAFVTISNGHGAWEMALSNTLSGGDRVLVLECGRFASVWGEMATFNGLDVEVLVAEAGRAVDPAAVEARLRADAGHEFAAVLAVHADTASSVRNDVAAIRGAIDAAGHPALFMVDCIATMGCEPYFMDDWGVDVTVAASQKGLMTPPGLGFVWAGPRALAARESAGLVTRYWDWSYRTEDGPHYLRYCGTPPVSHLFALREALRMVAEEGLAQRWERHRALGGAVRAAVAAWAAPGGLGLHVVAPDEQSNAVTLVHTGDVDATALSERCIAATGVTLGVGIGDFATSSFRIGHMGHVNVPMVMGVVGSVEAVLVSLDAPLGGSGAAAAASYLASSLASAPAEVDHGVT